jgi:hypothetical protein
MKSTFKLHSVTRSLMVLFVTKKGVNPHKRYPDAYYGRVAFDKPMFQGIELVAKIERLSKKKAARLLIERGFSSYMGEKVKEEIDRQRVRRENHQIKSPSRFAVLLRKIARERGMDISKFI